MIDADHRDAADLSAIERDREQRLRLALRNRRQRELYGPSIATAAASLPAASNVGSSSSALDARFRSGQISCGIWATTIEIPHGHARSTESVTALPRMH